MDYLKPYIVEIIGLGIDGIFFTLCLKYYSKYNNAVKKIEAAPHLDIDEDLKEILETSPEHKLEYISLRGKVKAIGTPIVSSNNSQVTGVVQSIKIKEHVTQRDSGGFWSDRERLIHDYKNTTPFALEANGSEVEVIDPLSADILDLDLISNSFNQTSPSVVDHIWGFFQGYRPKGVQTTEEMLKTGTILTGIGELVTSKNGSVKLQPPSSGTPFYLTKMEISTLINKLNNNKKVSKIFCYVFGAVAIVIGGLIVKRYWKLKYEKIEQEKFESTRRERRSRVRNDNLSEDQTCVICKTHPREIILLPCGHVCLCEDCLPGINMNCPICRRVIKSTSPAYIV